MLRSKSANYALDIYIFLPSRNLILMVVSTDFKNCNGWYVLLANTGSSLEPNGIVHLADNEEVIKARNNMHNRLVADAFMPAGGRPSTIDMSKYRNFLLPDGSPSSRF
jgi:hypothetical protein